jgi:hypothetical protein
MNPWCWFRINDRGSGLRLLGPEPQKKVIMERDSLELVNLWQSGEEHRSAVYPIIQDIWIMSSVFCRSRCNISRELGIWAGDPPSFLLRQLLTECNHYNQWITALSKKNSLKGQNTTLWRCEGWIEWWVLNWSGLRLLFVLDVWFSW